MILDLALDGATQRTGTENRVEAAVGEQVARLVGQLDVHVALGQRLADAADQQVDHLDDFVLGQLVEDDDVVDTVEELRAEVLLQLVVDAVLHALVLRIRVRVVVVGEAEPHRLRDVLRAQVRGEDEHRVLEIHDATLAIGQPAILKHLQQGVVDLLVGLFDLIEKHHGERLAADLLGQLAALVVADVSRRGAEQAGGGEAVVELAHVDLDEILVRAEEELRQRLGQLSLTHTGRAGEDEGTGWAVRILQAGAGAPDSTGDGLDRLVLADDALVQLVFHAQQAVGFLLGELEHRDARPVCEHLGDLVLADLRDLLQVAGLPLLFLLGALLVQLALGLAQAGGLLEVLGVNRRFLLGADLRDAVIDVAQPLRRGHALDAHAGAGLVQEVDCLIRQEAVVDVAVRQACGRLERLVRVGDAVVRLVLVAQAAENLHGVVERRLIDLDRLEAALQGRVLLDVLAVLLQRGGTDGLQLTARQLRLEQRGGVDSALGCTGTDERVNLIDKQDDVAALVNLLEHLLQALLKVTAVAGTGDERAQVQRVNLLVLQGLRHAAIDDVQRQTFHNRGLAHAGLTDENRVVLGAAREHLHDALDLGLAADDWVQLAVLRRLGQVAAELIEHEGVRAIAGALIAATGATHAAAGTGAGASQGRAATVAIAAITLVALITGKQLDNLLAHAREIRAQLGQHLGGHALALTDEAEQQELGADVLVPHLQALPQGELEHLLGARGERDVARVRLGALADNLFDFLADVF